MGIVKTSYSKDDAIVLLKDLSAEMKPLSVHERENLIQSGVHYSEMLPEEKRPSAEYSALYNKALTEKAEDIAKCTAKLGEMMMARCTSGKPVIVSLARAGIPAGVLIKRYIKQKYNINCNHYSISIIRDKGIDVNAMEFIYSEEIEKGGNAVENILFVDGWTGKGVIKEQLRESVMYLHNKSSKWDGLSDDLFVIADPANVTPYCGTRVDYLLPIACLNSTVSGLISRTILNDYIGEDDFHGAVYFKQFEDIDKSNEFVDTVSEYFEHIGDIEDDPMLIDIGWSGMDIVDNICKQFNIADYKKVKPGIGETTRVLLRRLPWKVLINSNISNEDSDIAHILVLCKEKNIPIERYDIGHYKVCGIIKELSADA